MNVLRNLNILEVHYILLVIFLIIIVMLIINILKCKKIENELNKSKKALQKNLNFLMVILDTIPQPFFSKNLEEKYTECNKEFTKVLGMKRENIINKTAYEINQQKFANVYHKADMELINKKEKQVYESKVKFFDGKVHDVVFRKAAIFSHDNKIQGLVGIMIDITARKKNENKIKKLLKSKEAMLEINQSITVINNMYDLFDLILEKAIEITDEADHGSILLLNEKRILKVVAFKQFDAKKMKNFSLPLEESFIWIKTKGNIKTSVIIDNIEELDEIKVVETTKEKKKWEIKSVISTPIIIEGKLFGMLDIDSDKKGAFTQDDVQIMEHMRSQIEIVISKHKLYEEILYLSKFDKLTGLYNRNYYERIFEKDFKEYVQKNQMFKVVVFDLNKLKRINDVYGHLVGDECIRNFSKVLKKIAHTDDILIRYGGDEFLGLFFGWSEKKFINELEKLVEYFKNNPLKYEQHNIICTFSYGISTFPYDSNVYSELIKIADERMYNYKRNL